MILSFKACLTLIALATLHSLLLAQGKDIEIVMNNGARLENLELVFVRDSALIVCTRSPDGHDLDTAGLFLVKTRYVRETVVSGESKVLSGMGTGLAIGGGLGALIGLGSGDDHGGFIRFSAGEKALVLGSTLGAAGLLIGLAAGAASSTPGRKVEPLPGGDLSVLKAYARYPRSEPWFLKDIQ